MEISVDMSLDSEKKHSIRYDSMMDDVIRTIYIKKEARIFENGTPPQIKVRVVTPDDS